MYKIMLFCCAVLLNFSGIASAGDNFIGGLRKVHGEGHVIRQGRSLAAKDGLHIYQGDILKTGKDGAMGIMFLDDTRISLGPDSQLILSKYVFNPAENMFGMLAKMVQGTASYLSGKLSKLSPQSVSIETPDATIGTRGTSFLVKVKRDRPADESPPGRKR